MENVPAGFERDETKELPVERTILDIAEEIVKGDENKLHQSEQNPISGLFNFFGQLGTSTADTVANAVGSGGQMAGLLFSGKVEKREIPNYNLNELVERFEKWLRNKKRGEVSSFSRSIGSDVYHVIRLKESGFFAGDYMFIFAASALEVLTEPIRQLEFEGKKYNGITLIVDEWPATRYTIEKELSYFIWRDGVKLGKDGPAPDYVSSWLIDLTNSQFAKRELIETIPEESRRFSKDLTFVHREEEWERIGRSLLAAESSRAGLPWIFSLTSEGGVGKSYLLKQVFQVYGIRLLEAKIDHDHYREVKGNHLALIAIIADKLKLQGCGTPYFDKAYRFQLQIEEDAEKATKPSAADIAHQVGKIAGGAAAKKVAGQIGKTFKRLGFVKHLPGMVGVSASLLEIGFNLYGQLPKEQQLEIDLFLGSRPVQDLTNALVLDISNFVREQRQKYYIWKHPTLVFDTYEEGGPVLDQWIRSVLLTNSLFLDTAPFIFIAGRFNLYTMDSRWTEYQSALHTIHLKGFSREETAQYLEKLGVIDSNQVNRLYALTGGLPLFLHLAAKIPDETLAVEILAKRILEEVEPEWRGILLEVALLDHFSPQTIKNLPDLRPRVEQILEKLIGVSFVEFKNGNWQYLPPVRRILLKHKSQRGTKFKI